MALPSDYLERVYAGVLGKIIGVYLGRPFEGWSYELISEHLGEINYYVHEKLNVPLIVTDDDISGTFTFVRALQDYGYSKDLTPAQIGHTWMNYLINSTLNTQMKKLVVLEVCICTSQRSKASFQRNKEENK